MRRALAGVLLILSSMLAAVPRAFADEGKRPDVALVTIAADDAELAIVEAGLGEGLDRLAVHARTMRAARVRPDEVVRAMPAGRDVLARVWVDLSSPEEIVLFVADRTGSRVLVRRFTRLGRAEIAREEAMAALQSAIDALLHGGTIGVSVEEARGALGLPEAPAPPEEPAAPVTPAPPPPMRPRAPPGPRSEATTTLGLGVGYELGGYADRLVEQGPVAAISVSRPFEDHTVALRLSGQYRVPIEATTSPIAIRVTAVALRALAEVSLLPRGRIPDVRLALGGGVDLTHAEPRVLHTVDASLSQVSRADAVVRGGVLVRLPTVILSRSTVELGAALDVAPSVRSFAVAHAGAPVEMVAPWAVRPLLTLGIAVP